jgi:cysteine synthase A
MTGSIKDRLALHIMRKAYEERKIHPGSVIAEATSGNTGISFAAIGSVLGHPVAILIPDGKSHERRDLIRRVQTSETADYTVPLLPPVKRAEQVQLPRR